jgi:S1-C subfamily serine protease
MSCLPFRAASALLVTLAAAVATAQEQPSPAASDTTAADEDTADPEDPSADPDSSEPPAEDSPDHELSEATSDRPEAGETLPGECGEGWEAAAYKDAVESVVRVKTPNGWGAGFFFEDGLTVITALHVVEIGRSVQVVARTGETRRARVVHNANQELDLAVLRLDRPFESFKPKPLERSPHEPTVAMPVMMIGHPGSEGGGWSVSWGRIGSAMLDNGAIEVDGTANPGNSGGPLLDCQGRVLGVVSYLKDTGITMAVPIEELPREGDRRFHFYQGALAAAVRFPNVVFSREEDFSLWGIGVGADLVVRDRWVTALQGHYQWHAERPGGSLIELTERRWQIELYEEFRVLALGYLGIGFGGAISWDTQKTTVGRVDDTTAPPSFAVDYHRDRSVRLRPMVTASWEPSPFHFGYAYQIDTLNPGLSTHRLVFGIRSEDVLSYE